MKGKTTTSRRTVKDAFYAGRPREKIPEHLQLGSDSRRGRSDRSVLQDTTSARVASGSQSMERRNGHGAVMGIQVRDSGTPEGPDDRDRRSLCIRFLDCAKAISYSGMAPEQIRASSDLSDSCSSHVCRRTNNKLVCALACCTPTGTYHVLSRRV